MEGEEKIEITTAINGYVVREFKFLHGEDGEEHMGVFTHVFHDFKNLVNFLENVLEFNNSCPKCEADSYSQKYGCGECRYREGSDEGEGE